LSIVQGGGNQPEGIGGSGCGLGSSAVARGDEGKGAREEKNKGDTKEEGRSTCVGRKRSGDTLKEKVLILSNRNGHRAGGERTLTWNVTRSWRISEKLEQD